MTIVVTTAIDVSTGETTGHVIFIALTSARRDRGDFLSCGGTDGVPL